MIRIVYIGNMSLSYDLATAVDAVKGDAELTLDLAGAGPDEAALRALLAQADVGLVPMFDDSCVGVPYKLADYAAAGLPVASSLHGETADLLARCAAGVTYMAGDLAALRAAVRVAVGRRAGVAALAAAFDAQKLYAGYVAFATAL